MVVIIPCNILRTGIRSDLMRKLIFIALIKAALLAVIKKSIQRESENKKCNLMKFFLCVPDDDLT